MRDAKKNQQEGWWDKKLLGVSRLTWSFVAVILIMSIAYYFSLNGDWIFGSR